MNNKFAKAKDFVQIGIDAEEYFDLEKTESTDSFSVKMVKKKFDTPVTHTPEEYDFPDSLYQDMTHVAIQIVI